MRVHVSKKIVFPVLLFFLSLIVAGSPALAGGKSVKELLTEAKSQITEITPQQVFEDLQANQAMVLLDVRTEAEFQAGHLPQAINIPRGLLEFRIGSKVKDLNTPIVVYCRSGARGAFATQTLMAMGYTNVKNMDTAFMGWSTAGYPVYNRHGEFTLRAFEKKG